MAGVNPVGIGLFPPASIVTQGLSADALLATMTAAGLGIPLRVERNVTNAEVLVLNSAPIELVAAPSDPNTVLVPFLLQFSQNRAVGYAAASRVFSIRPRGVAVNYLTTGAIAQNNAASVQFNIIKLSGVQGGIAGQGNGVGLELQANSDTTLGSPNNTMKVVVIYYAMPIVSL